MLAFSGQYALANVPVITCTEASFVTATSAGIGITIKSDGGYPIVESGIAYGTGADPDITGPKVSAGTSVTTYVTGLTANTLYHFRAYATNSSGTAYTADATFITLSDSLVYQWTTRTTPGWATWRSIASSADGTRLVAAQDGGSIYTSNDSGITWIERTGAGTRTWRAVASSSDGNRLVAAGGGYIYTSDNAGETWTQRTDAGNRYWWSIALSSDGAKIVGTVFKGYIYTSADSGATWVEQTVAGNRYWGYVASSSDGNKIVATEANGYIYTSTDSGATWAEQRSAGDHCWAAVASSSNGTRLVAADYEGGYIYTSTDSGTSWVQQTGAGPRMWTAVASSSDGTQLVALEEDGHIHTSTDSGANWIQQTSAGSRSFETVASSSDGAKLVAAGTGSYIYTSPDSGVSWIQQMSPNQGYDVLVASSSDGTRLFAAESGNIYTSIDSGATWTQQTNPDNHSCEAIVSSADGARLVCADNMGYIYTSTDSGTTWTQRTSAGSRNWRAVASSSDGTKLIALVEEGYVYTSSDSGATWIERTSAGTRIWWSAASSADGTMLVAAPTGGYIYRSTDSGATWTEQTNAGFRYWASIASSFDGTRLVAADLDGFIYISRDSGATWAEQTSAGYRNWNTVASSSDGVVLAALDQGRLHVSGDSGTTWTQQTSVGNQNCSLWVSPDGSRIIAGSDRFSIGSAPATASAPSIDSPAASSLTTTSATLGATIESNGGAFITAAGVAYGTDANPDIAGSKVSSEVTGGTFTNDVTGLIPNTLYHFRGYATNSQATSYTSDSTFTTLADAPVAAAATGVTSTGFTANWTAPSGTAAIAGYRLDVATDSGFTSFVAGYNDQSVSGTSMGVTGLSSNVPYYYRVRAVNAGGVSSNSNTASATTVAGAPAAIAATGISVNGFTANWTAPSGTAAIAGYRLDVATDSGFTSFVAGYNDQSVSGTSMGVTGLSSNVPYYYRVRAVNAGGVSSNSNTASATTVAGAPAAIAATGISVNGFTANWSAPSGTAAIAGYRLDVATDSGFTSFVAGYSDLFVSGTSTAVTGLPFNGMYYYRVRAVNAGGTGSNSDVVSAATIAGAPVATAATGVTSAGFTANWNVPSGTALITGYRLDVATDSGFNTFVPGYNNLSVAGTSASVTGLSPSGTYYYRVRAVNAGGTSSSSNTITAVTSAPPLMTITSPDGTASWKAGSKQTISWTYNGTPGSKVRIELLKAGSVTKITSSTSSGKGGNGSYTWTLPSTLRGTDYQVRVTSTTNSSYTATSSNFTVEGPTITLDPIQNSTAANKLSISWKYTGSPGNVKIELLQGGSPIKTIKSSTSAGKNNAGSYSWTIPKTQATGAYQVRVTAVASGECTSTSNSFTIAGPTITLNTIQNATAGGKLSISWGYTGSPGNVKIELLKGGSPVKTIKSSTSAGKNSAGSYIWPIPKTQASGSDYQVRVTATANNSCSGISPAFSIGSVQASAGPDQHAKASAVVNLSALNSTGVKEASAGYKWTQTSGPTVELSDPNAAETIFLAPENDADAKSLGFQLTVTNGEGVKSEDSCIVNVSENNTAPIAEAGPNQAVLTAQIVEIDGSRSSAPDSIISYTWRQISGTPAALTDAFAMQTTFVAPDVTAAGESLVFELTVTDQAGLRSRDTCVVNVIWQNQPPVANAGQNQTVRPGARVVLDGTGSIDEDGAIASFRWKQIAGKPVTLSDPTAIMPSFLAPVVDGDAEELVFQLFVTDAGGLQGSAKASVFVSEIPSGRK